MDILYKCLESKKTDNPRHIIHPIPKEYTIKIALNASAVSLRGVDKLNCRAGICKRWTLLFRRIDFGPQNDRYNCEYNFDNILRCLSTSNFTRAESRGAFTWCICTSPPQGNPILFHILNIPDLV